MPQPSISSATPQQASVLLSHQLDLLASKPALAHELPPVMLWGPPGVGKSSVVREVAHSKSVGFIDIRLSQREPVDLRGLPVPDQSRKVVDWWLPGEFPRNPSSRGIILFDELTAADRSLQVAAYELILDRRLGDLYQLPDGWLVVAAGNRASDRAVAQTLSSALANRFCHLSLEPDVDTWVKWATQQGLHPDVVSFLRFRPASFFDMESNLEQGWPSPRSWTRVAQSLTHAESLSPDVLSLLVNGLVGPIAGNEFLAFRDWSSKLPDLKAMLDGEVPIAIPERVDQRYAFCTGLSFYLWSDISNEDILSPSTNERLTRFFDISQKLSSDFATLMLFDAMSGSDDESSQLRSAALFGHTSFDAWSQQHGTAFQTYFPEFGSQ